jgi:hypothetical protein
MGCCAPETELDRYASRPHIDVVVAIKKKLSEVAHDPNLALATAPEPDTAASCGGVSNYFLLPCLQLSGISPRLSIKEKLADAKQRSGNAPTTPIH